MLFLDRVDCCKPYAFQRLLHRNVKRRTSPSRDPPTYGSNTYEGEAMASGC